MSTVEIKGFVHAVPNHDGTTEYVFRSIDMSGTEGFGVLVGPATFAYEVPADFNPVNSQLRSLHKQLESVNREFAEKVRKINDQIKNLEAIEYTPEAAS